MLLIIHGDHQSNSRQALQHQIQIARQSGVTDITTLDGKACSLTDLIQAGESSSLFSPSDRLLILENLFRRRSKTELTDIINYLSTSPPVHLIIWEDKQLSATQIKSLAQFKALGFPLPKIIFKLTDAFIPKANVSNLINLLNQACAADSAELTLIMLARQLRLQLQGRNRGPRFDPQTAIGLHHQLAEIDFKNKTGQLSLDLKSELVNWMIKVYSN